MDPARLARQALAPAPPPSLAAGAPHSHLLGAALAPPPAKQDVCAHAPAPPAAQRSPAPVHSPAWSSSPVSAVCRPPHSHSHHPSLHRLPAHRSHSRTRHRAEPQSSALDCTHVRPTPAGSCHPALASVVSSCVSSCVSCVFLACSRVACPQPAQVLHSA